MNKKGVYKIRTTDYYGEFQEAVRVGASEDRHDLKPADILKLHTGQKLLVQWPNGKITTETIEVVQGNDSAQVDMNNCPDHFPTQKIYAVHRYQGQKTRVSLKSRLVRPSRKG